MSYLIFLFDVKIQAANIKKNSVSFDIE